MSNSHRDSARDLHLSCGIITCSDTRSLETDSSGSLIESRLESEGHRIAWRRIIRDEPSAIQQVLRDRDEVDVVLINGGTGIAKRDNTFDTLVGLIEKPMPGFGEIFRVLSFEEIGAAAMLSRATAGVIGRTLIFSMPGSTPAVRLALEKLILPDLKHLVWEIRKGE